MGELVYKKRPGTSGISGQLYETKLISLILYKVRQDQDIEDFYIGTNVDGLGVFDDICFRIKFKGFKKQLAVFLQAKHKDDHNKEFTLKMTDLAKYFYSFLNIKNKFNSNDGLFRCEYEDVECVLVFYTTTKDKLKKQRYENNFADKLNNLICTGDKGQQLQYSNDEVDFLSKLIFHEQINELAHILIKYYRSGQKNHALLMNENLIKKFHVILAEFVFNVSTPVQEGEYRIGTFQKYFFNHTHENLITLKHCLCSEMLLTQKLNPESLNVFLSLFLKHQSVYSLSKLIGNIVKYNRNTERLEFIDKNMADELKDKLSNIPVTASMIGEAINMGGVPLLQNAEFHFHHSFGNYDLTLRGNETKIEKRLQYLADKIKALLEKSRIKFIDNKRMKIVELNDNFSDTGFLKINGGIGGAVGNLLVIDNETRLLKFEDVNALSGFSHALYKKIENIGNLEEYRFDIQLDYFPTLRFDLNARDKIFAKEFLEKLLFYTNQAKEDVAEIILKQIINSQICSNSIQSDSVFLKYHDSIQKWWMTKSTGQYLTKQYNMLNDISTNLCSDPLLGLTNMYYNNVVNQMNLMYSETVVQLLRLSVEKRVTLMITTAVSLTIIKICQCFKRQNYRLLDLNYISSLPDEECNHILQLLSTTEISGPIILACSNFIELKTLKQTEVLYALERKNIIIVTNPSTFKKLQPCLTVEYLKIYDESINLTDLTEESQEYLIKNTEVYIQGIKLNLDLLLDDKSKKFIKGHHIHEIFENKYINVGSSLADPRYKDIQKYFVVRSITKIPKAFYDYGVEPDHGEIEFDEFDRLSNRSDDHTEECIMLHTIDDIPDQNIVIKAGPGMGKSTLLTHLAVQTKANNPKVWIVRLNLLDYSRKFLTWHENKVKIDLINSMQLICESLIYHKESFTVGNTDIHLHNVNDEILLNRDSKYLSDDCILDLNFFLHFYNYYQVLFLFDGFDEVCPHYKNEVLAFLNIMKHCNLQKHRIVITTRRYNNVQQLLDPLEFTTYKLNYLHFEDHEIFIEKFLDTKLNLNDLNLEQLEKLNNFITFIKNDYAWQDDKELLSVSKCQTMPLHNLYLDVVNYYQKQVKHVLYLQNKDKYLQSWNADVFIIKICKQFNGRVCDKNTMRQLITTPLHLFILADYFQNEIRNTKNNTKWDLTFNTHLLYELFLETKLKNIRFEDKNKMDLSIPDVRSTFERERKEFITVHQQLAAYAYFHENNWPLLFNESEINQIKAMIESIKSGEEKTGVICSVTNDMPKFIHFSFTEYFAVGYFCDILKQEKLIEKLESLWDFVLNAMYFNYNIGILNIMDDKLIVDEKLKAVCAEDHNRQIIAKLLLQQGEGTVEYVIDNFTLDDVYLEKVIHSSLQIAINDHLKNFLWLFAHSLEDNVNVNNLDSFTRLFAETNMLLDAAVNFEFINRMLNIVRKIDETNIKYMFDLKHRWHFNYNDTNDGIIEQISEYHRGRRTSKVVNYGRTSESFL